MTARTGISIILLLAVSWIDVSGKNITSTPADQSSLEVTVYSGNLGLVKDTRIVSLEKGEINLSFAGVASSIKPETVRVISLNHNEDISIIEQDYEYDLINRERLLDSYVGSKIKLISYDQDNNPKRAVDAVLLSNNGGPVYEIEGKIYLGFPGYPVLPGSASDLVASPALIWKINSSAQQAHSLEVSYLTEGISWKADYVMAVDKEDSSADLTVWITVINNSGAEYKNTSLNFVAGDVNKVPEFRGRMAFAAMEDKAASFAREEELHEFHIYKFAGKVDMKDRQDKQVRLLKASAVPVKKELVATSGRYNYLSRYGTEAQKMDIGVYLTFMNDEKSNLGMALPGGTVRVYKEDSDKSLQFIGEDNIQHTPRDEYVKIKTGNAFDILCERKQMDYQKTGKNTYEIEWEIAVINHKEKEEEIIVEERLAGDWKILRSSHEYEKKGAFNVAFKVKAAKNSEEKIIYRVRVDN
ncbi:MAG: DUF4139 domain-containing protein [Elusimicrobia bacterium]|nr:DUF4139 domain-containing protein [Elusimicrobiota bacterium]